MKSGNYMDIVCETATFAKNSDGTGYDSYDIKNVKNTFGLCPNEIEAWKQLR